MDRRFPPLFVIIIACILTGSVAAQNLVINSNDVMPRSSPESTGYEDLILKEAFRRVGASFDRITVPPPEP